jgi:tryptophan halogenase
MKVVVLGGGTAGWLAALILSSVHKGVHEVLVVSSSEYPTIGVGESGTGLLRGVVNNEVYDYGCNEYDFMKHAHATPKLGVFYKNWNSTGDYFEPLNAWCRPSHIDSDPLLISYVARGVDPSLSTLHGRLFQSNLSGFYKSNGLIYSHGIHTYNFDSGLAGDYFKNICLKNGVKYVDLTIEDALLDDRGNVTHLVTKDGKKVKGDFFVDATGFRRFLASKLKVRYIQDTELLVNSALVFDSKLNEKVPATTASAQNHGWSWTIPKIYSNGTGYVYSDYFIDQDTAHKEINKFYKKEVDVIKSIKFKSGALQTFWEKNCIFVGVGSQFFEPLEATSIHGTIAQINMFAFNFLKKDLKSTLLERNVKKYNEAIRGMVEHFKNLILVHYITDKTNSDFWIEMNNIAKENSFLNDLYEQSKISLLNLNDFNHPSYAGIGVETYNHVFAMTKNYSVKAAKKEYAQPYNYKFARISEENLCKDLENKDWLSLMELISFVKGL